CGVTKSWRQNADNRVEIVVQADGAADNVGVGGKVASPNAIADDHDRRITGYRVLLTEQPSLLGDCPEHGEIRGTDNEQCKTLRLRSTGPIDAPSARGTHVLEHACAISKVVHFGHGEPDAM